MQYDIVVPFGTSCICSDILRDIGMQSYSYPFDWVGGGTIKARTDILIHNFSDWLNYENLVQITPINPTEPRKFKDFANIKTNMTFRHHFSCDKSSLNFLADYNQVLSTYNRRAQRLLTHIQLSNNVLILTIETPNRPAITDTRELVEAHNMIAKKFPTTKIDMLYIKRSNKNSSVNKINKNILLIEDTYDNLPGSKSDIGALIQTIFNDKNITLSDKFSR